MKNVVDRFLAFDCETFATEDGIKAPPLVCASIADANGGELLSREQARHVFPYLLDSDRVLVTANGPFDLLVMAADAAERGIDLMPAIYDKLEREEVYDVLTSEALYGIANGHFRQTKTGYDLRNAEGKVTKAYGLFNVLIETTGRVDAKVNDEWRRRYGELVDIPIADWPATARQYPVDDSVNTREAAVAQVTRHAIGEVTNLHDLANQVYSHWAMHLGAAWGLSVDPDAVVVLKERVTAARAAELPRWIGLGILRERGPKADKGEVAVVAPCEHQDPAGEHAQPCLACRFWSCDTARLCELVARAYGANDPCPECGGRCWQCRGTGRVPGARANTTKKCPNCGGGRPKCEACQKTGVDLSTALVPRADKGGVSKGRDQLNESADDTLIEYASWLEDKKILETYVPYLERGVGRPLTLRPNVLVETGRKSYGDVIDQFPRSGGVRECVKARDGWVLSSTDYGQIELYTHAQSCLWLLGYSSLADALNQGIEVHVRLAAEMGGLSYEDALARHLAGDPLFKPLRQTAKPGNYGFPGGMGAYKLVLQQRAQGPDTKTASGRVYKGLRFCVLVRGAETCGVEKITSWKGREYPPACRACVEVSEELREAWFEFLPENHDYFKLVAVTVDEQGWVKQHVSNRIRGDVRFTSAANGYFQALAADGMKAALRVVSRECNDRRLKSPLFGSRFIFVPHDEFIMEHPEDVAPEAAARVGEVMVAEMAPYVPDVAKNLSAEPALMRRWYKGAEAVYDAAGRLVPWEPE